jgi:transposase-like protein
MEEVMAQVEDTRLVTSVGEALLDDPMFLRDIVATALQEMLEAGMTEHLNADPHERTSGRRGYRNGYKPRQLKMRVGTVDLLVPQDRDGTFKPELFDRYQRNEKALTLALMEMSVKGVSTRKVADITEKLCGTTFSKSTVSRLSADLDEELEAWRNRPLEQAYPYLMVDARYEYVRIDGRVVSQGVLIVKGVRADGRREILAVAVADTESEATYDELFGGLKDRGLHGVQLVISDSHRGLRKAIERNFQGAAWQRCQVHFKRNALGKVAMKHREKLGEDLKDIFEAPTREGAFEALSGVVSRWSETHPAVASWIEEGIEDCLACYSFPEAHRRRIRSTNPLERFNQEIKRRTRVVRIFPNRASCLRLVSALCAEQSEHWISGRRYLDMSLLEARSSGQADRPDPTTSNTKEANMTT